MSEENIWTNTYNYNFSNALYQKLYNLNINITFSLNLHEYGVQKVT